MAQSSTLYVGMAVHQESMAVASVAQDHGAEVVSLGTIGTRPCDSDQRLRQLRSKSTPLCLRLRSGPLRLLALSLPAKTRRRLLGRRPCLDA